MDRSEAADSNTGKHLTVQHVVLSPMSMKLAREDRLESCQRMAQALPHRCSRILLEHDSLPAQECDVCLRFPVPASRDFKKVIA